VVPKFDNEAKLIEYQAPFFRKARKFYSAFAIELLLYQFMISQALKLFLPLKEQLVFTLRDFQKHERFVVYDPKIKMFFTVKSTKIVPGVSLPEQKLRLCILQILRFVLCIYEWCSTRSSSSEYARASNSCSSSGIRSDG